ncbi:MAG: adenylyl-sulfate kinase [Armatimonadaceae bacterium]
MSENIQRQEYPVTRVDREKNNGHRGAVVWFTGLSGAGKSTISAAVEQELTARGLHTYSLDGDNIRFGLCQDLGFSANDRAENIRRIGEVAALMLDAGLIVLSAFISPAREHRDAVRKRLPEGCLIEVYVATSLEACEARDVKGLYAKARAGEIKGFTGIDDPYEAPESAELALDTAGKSVDACVQEVIRLLETRNIIQKR